MNKFIKSFMVVALASVMAFAVAQDQGQGGQGRRAGGGFGAGMQRGNRGGGLLQLALRADVQKDIAVTDEQKTKLEALRPARGQRGGGAGGNGGGGNGGTRNGGGAGGGQVDMEAMRKAQEERAAKEKTDLAAILSADQMKRLDEISVQLQGNRALQNEKTQKALGLSEEQITKIKDLQTKQREAMTSIMEKMRNQELTREEMQSTMEKNNKAMDEELAKILTADQKSKFDAMKGKPFKADEQPRRGGGGGN